MQLLQRMEQQGHYIKNFSHNILFLSFSNFTTFEALHEQEVLLKRHFNIHTITPDNNYHTNETNQDIGNTYHQYYLKVISACFNNSRLFQQATSSDTKWTFLPALNITW